MGAAANEIGRNEPTDERVAAALCNLLLTYLALEYRAPAAWIDMSYAALSRPMSKHDSPNEHTSATLHQILTVKDGRARTQQHYRKEEVQPCTPSVPIHNPRRLPHYMPKSLLQTARISDM